MFDGTQERLHNEEKITVQILVLYVEKKRRPRSLKCKQWSNVTCEMMWSETSWHTDDQIHHRETEHDRHYSGNFEEDRIGDKENWIVSTYQVPNESTLTF